MSKELRTLEIKKVLNKTRILKTLSWRITGWILTTLLTWMFFGDIKAAMSIGFIDVVVKLVGFYIHDLMWERKAQSRIKEIKNKYPKE